MRYTPDNITTLKKGEIFVFGSNLFGIHLNGAAKLAVSKFGAVEGQGVGLQGQSYAIPTMLGCIVSYVNDFIVFAAKHQELTFLVTRIGCGTASYTDRHIAPLFREALKLPNVVLPKQFVDVLQGPQEGALALGFPGDTGVPSLPFVEADLEEYIYRLSDYCPMLSSTSHFLNDMRRYAVDRARIEQKVMTELEQNGVKWPEETILLRVDEIRYAAALGNVIAAFLSILRGIPGEYMSAELLDEMLAGVSHVDADGFCVIRDEALRRLENIREGLRDLSWGFIVNEVASIFNDAQFRLQGTQATWLINMSRNSAEMAKHVRAVNTQRVRTEFAGILLDAFAMVIRYAERRIPDSKGSLSLQVHRLWMIIDRDANEIAERVKSLNVVLLPGLPNDNGPKLGGDEPKALGAPAPGKDEISLWIEQCYQEVQVKRRKSDEHLYKCERLVTPENCEALVRYLIDQQYLENDREQILLFIARVTGRWIKEKEADWKQASKERIRWHSRSCLELMSLYRALAVGNISARELKDFFVRIFDDATFELPDSIPSASYRLDRSPTKYEGLVPSPSFQKQVCEIVGIKYH